MIRSRRGGLVTVLALTMSGALAACGGGETRSLGSDYPNAEVGSMAVRSVLLVASPDGKDANVVMTLINHGVESDTLRQVTVSRAEREGRAQASVFIQVQPGEAVNVGSPGQPAVVIPGIDAVAKPGESVDLDLLFESAGGTRLTTVVQAAAGFYASYTPTALPTSESPTGGPSPSVPPSPGAAASTGPATPTGSPTASPTASGSPG